MSDKQSLISDAFKLFLSEQPEHAQAWGGAVAGLGQASVLDSKTQALCYLSVMASVGLESGLAYHVVSAKEAGATREEVGSAVLVGLTAVGHKVIHALPIALNAFDEADQQV